ncbi:hypothetical protein [Streptomyces sp. LaBMicrA B280]|uniref:hypothetical protein n=1 Tax=Streptomyces sp. LaBMicrA B280 TaxID=3391001 RepID=UPI003BA5B295
MTTTCDTWTLTGPVDAARARALLARLTADAGVPARDRARFLAVLTALLRPSREGRRQRLTVTAAEDLHIALDGAEPWRHTLACPSPLPRPLPRPGDLAEADLAEALLGAGEDTAVVLAGLDEAEELVRFHREELHQTNQGVLALHAELEAAALAQRELLDAERAARAEAENARRLLTFLADASASLNASLDHEDILRRLPKLLVPEHARQVDVWLVDDERTPPAERAAAAVTAARTGRPQHAAPQGHGVRREGQVPGGTRPARQGVHPVRQQVRRRYERTARLRRRSPAGSPAWTICRPPRSPPTGRCCACRSARAPCRAC